MSNGLNWWDIWLEEIPFLHHDGEILDSVEMIDCLYHLVLGGGSHHNAGCIYFCLAVSKIMSCLALTLLGCIIVKICEVSSSYKSCIVNRHGDRYDYTTIYCNSHSNKHTPCQWFDDYFPLGFFHGLFPLRVRCIWNTYVYIHICT
jgi:hypothetical protein